MTIHDILINCGSLTANTVIVIYNSTGDIITQHRFKYLPSKFESLKFVTYTVGFDFQYCESTPNLRFNFYL